MGAARQQVEQGIQLFNSGDLDALTALYAEDAVWVSPPGTFTGRQAIREEHERNRTAFPDRHLQTVRLLEDGDCVALECEVTLTHTGPMALPDGTQLPPSGYHATIRAVTIFEVHDGRTTAHRDYFDQLPAMVAMGAFSPPQ